MQAFSDMTLLSQYRLDFWGMGEPCRAFSDMTLLSLYRLDFWGMREPCRISLIWPYYHYIDFIFEVWENHAGLTLIISQASYISYRSSLNNKPCIHHFGIYISNQENVVRLFLKCRTTGNRVRDIILPSTIYPKCEMIQEGKTIYVISV